MQRRVARRRRQARLPASAWGTRAYRPGTCHLPGRWLSRQRIQEADLMRDKDRWRRRDHKFAVGTIALMVFLVVAGFTAWILNDGSSTAAPSSSHMSTR